MSLRNPLKNIKHKVGTKRKSVTKVGTIINTVVAKAGRERRKMKGKKTKFRSKFEEQFWLDNHTKINLRYEPFRINYSVVEERSYLPDFVYTDPFLKTNPYTVYEVKGWWRPSDRKKMKFLKMSNPGLRIVMVFQKDNYLTKSKKAKYSDWCIKNQIDYVIGTDLTKIIHASNPNRNHSKNINE